METNMDPALVELLTERMGLRPEEREALARGDVSTVFASRFGSDPRAAALLQAMAEQGTPHVPAREPAGDPARARPRARRRQRQDRVQRLVRRLHEELRAAHEVVLHVAHIFGACPACFGEDAGCEHCGGRGGPGTRRPAEPELLAWVAPALARLGLRVTAIDSHDQQATQDRENRRGVQDELSE